VYTDGACSGNPGPGGWAWLVPDGAFAAGFDPATTNQRMELTAVLEAVRALDGPLEIISDSTYVVNCFRDRWWEGWLRRGWINSQRKPVANRDLWEPIVSIYQERDLSFRWVKGHSGDPWNDLADRLAVEAATRLESRSGVKPPADVGPPDRPTPRTPTPRASEAAPEGHLVVVTGHRPPALGGYEDNPLRRAVRRRLVDVLAAKRSLHPDLVVLTGLGLGAETLAAEAAVEVAVPVVAVLAYPDFDSLWPAESRRQFRQLMSEARSSITLQRLQPANRQQAGAAQSRRDAWLRRHADEAIVVWDGADPAVGRAARGLADALGEENVWIIDPAELD
jgi:ribonuclease HI